MAAAPTFRSAVSDEDLIPLFEQLFTCNYNCILWHDKAIASKLPGDIKTYNITMKTNQAMARKKCEDAIRECGRNLNEYQQLVTALMTPLCLYLGYDKRVPLRNAADVIKLSPAEQQRVINVLLHYAKEEPATKTIRTNRLGADQCNWLFKVEELLKTSTLSHLKGSLSGRKSGGLDYLIAAGELVDAAKALDMLKDQPEVDTVPGVPFTIRSSKWPEATEAAFAPVDLCTSAMHSLAIASEQATSARWSRLWVNKTFSDEAPAKKRLMIDALDRQFKFERKARKENTKKPGCWRDIALRAVNDMSRAITGGGGAPAPSTSFKDFQERYNTNTNVLRRQYGYSVWNHMARDLEIFQITKKWFKGRPWIKKVYDKLPTLPNEVEEGEVIPTEAQCRLWGWYTFFLNRFDPAQRIPFLTGNQALFGEGFYTLLEDTRDRVLTITDLYEDSYNQDKVMYRKQFMDSSNGAQKKDLKWSEFSKYVDDCLKIKHTAEQLKNIRYCLNIVASHDMPKGLKLSRKTGVRDPVSAEHITDILQALQTIIDTPALHEATILLFKTTPGDPPPKYFK